MGRRKYHTRIDCQFALSYPHASQVYQLGFDRRKCPAETNVRRDCAASQSKRRKSMFVQEGSKEDGEKAPAAKRREVPKSQYYVLHLHEDNTAMA